MVSGFGLYGEDANKVTQKAANQAWDHVTMNGGGEVVLADPTVFLRNAIHDLRLGTFREVDLGNGQKRVAFVRGGY